MTKTPKAPMDKKPVSRETREPDFRGMAGHFLAFSIGERQLAFPLEKVERGNERISK